MSDDERIVARCLRRFKSFAELLEETGTELPQARLELMEQGAAIVEDALAYYPPATSC